MINKIEYFVSLVCPFPHIVNSSMKNGLVFCQPIICKNCSKKYCEKKIYIGRIEKCPYGRFFYSFLLDNNENSIFIINGLSIHKKYIKINRKKKKNRDINLTNPDSIHKWIESIRNIPETIENSVQNSVNNRLRMLHDVKTAVSIITRNTEVLIKKIDGASWDKQIESSPQEIKTLLESVSLLQERLKIMNLIANPKAATYGKKKPTPVYKVFDKIIKLFNSLALKKNVKPVICGRSHSQPELYQSFNTIPFALIDNAIKYSISDQEVKITINEDNKYLNVEVESFSIEILEDEQSKIFEKEARGCEAIRVTPEGSGLGLYLASIVAEANGFKIFHRKKGTRYIKDGQSYMINQFYFSIKK